MHNVIENINELNNLMLTQKNISKICDYSVSRVDEKKTSTHMEKKKSSVNINNNIFFPREKDKLFWCLYIILNGMDLYEMKNNYFTIEKEMKYKWVETLRTRKDLYKMLKITKGNVEGELANDSKISLNTLRLLCHLHEINIFYIDNKKFYEILTSDEKPIYVIEKIDKNYGLKQKVSTENIEYYRNNYWKLENLDKPLRAISYYKSNDLKEICKKLGIICDKLTKNNMYEEILKKL